MNDMSSVYKFKNNLKVKLKSYSGQTLVTFSGMIFLQLTNFIALIYIARGISPSEVGRYQLLMSLTIVLSLLTKAGLDEGLSYYLPRYIKTDKDNILGVIIYCTIFAVFFSFIAGLLARYSASFINNSIFQLKNFDADLRMIFYLLPSLVFLLISLSVLRGMGRSDLRGYIYYFFMSLCFLAGVIFMASHIMELDVLIYWRGIIFVISGILAFSFCHYLSNGKVNFPKYHLLKDLHTFSASIIFISFFQYLIEQPLIDLAIVGRYLSPDEVGIYAISARIGAIVGLGFSAMTIVMAPKVSRLVYLGDVDQYSNIYRTINNRLLWITSCCACVLYISIDGILPLIGKPFIEGKQIVMVFVIGYSLMSLAGLNLPFMLAFKKQKAEFLLSSISVVLMVTGGITLAKIFGLVGVACATVGSLVLLNSARYLILYKESRDFKCLSKESGLIIILSIGALAIVEISKNLFSDQLNLLTSLAQVVFFFILFFPGVFLLEKIWNK